MGLLVTSKAELQEDEFLVEELMDIQFCISELGDQTKYSYIKYVYSCKHNCLFCIAGYDKQIIVGKLADRTCQLIDAAYLYRLNIEYKQLFLQDTFIQMDLNGKTPEPDLLNIWYKFYSLFIDPVIGLFKRNSLRDVVTTFRVVIFGQPFFFNIPLIYDLSYRFSKHVHNSPMYFSNAGKKTTYDHVRDLLNAGVPEIGRMFILDGYDREYNRSNDNHSIPPAELKLLLFRETILDTVVAFLSSNGARCTKLSQLADWDFALSKDNDFNFILLMAHFHQKNLLLPEQSYIKFDDLVEYINEKKLADTLKNNIILDATTCNNFNDFSILRDKGIQYIHMSANNLSNDLSIYILNELCFGNAARSLNWEFPYLNGKRYLHTIYSDINRAFYVKMKLEGRIYL